MGDDDDKRYLKKCLIGIIDGVHESIAQLRPNQQNSQASTTDIHSFTLDKSEDIQMDLLRMTIETTVKSYVKHVSSICRNYLYKFLQPYHYDEKTGKFTNSFNMDSLIPLEHDLEAALASIDAFTAAWNGDKDTVLQFINKYPTLKDKPGLHGTTLLYSAAKNNREVLVRYLVQEAHCAIDAQNQQQLADVLQMDLSSTYQNRNPSAGSTALHGACYAGHLNIVKYLIKNDADYFIKNQILETPMMNGEMHSHIRAFFEDFLILGYSIKTKTLPEKPISERIKDEIFDCIWEYTSSADQQWIPFSDDESKELNKSLIVLPDQEMQRTIYLGVPPNNSSVSIIEFRRTGKGRDIKSNNRVWIRCRGSSIFNFDCFSRWQIMILKHTGITTKSEPSMKIVDIPTIYDSNFHLQLDCWYNCTRNISSHLDNAMNYRRKRITLDLKFVGNDLEFDFQTFTFANREQTISGCIRWIPKLIANDERYQNKIHEVDNYENLSHVQPIPFTTKRLREISKVSHTASTSKSDDDIFEEDENDQDPTSPSLFTRNVDDDDLDDADQGIKSSGNEQWSLFDIKSNEDTTSIRVTPVDNNPEKSLADNLQEELTNTSLSQQVSLQEQSISIANLTQLRAEMEAQQQEIKKTTDEVKAINDKLDQKNKENQHLENELSGTKKAHLNAQKERERQSSEILKLQEEINQLQAAQKASMQMKQKADKEVEKRLAAAQAEQKRIEEEKERKIQEILDFAKKIKNMEANNTELMEKNEAQKQQLDQQLKAAQEKQKIAEKEKQRQAEQISELDKLIKELQVHNKRENKKRQT